jgi:aldose 1-epimerase
MTITGDSELVLTSGEYGVVVSPMGGSLRRYFQKQDGAEIDLVWGYSGAHNKKGAQGDVLIPFPGRIAYGRYSFNGRQFQLPCNDKEGPNAIHGFARSVIWSIQDTSQSHVTFEHVFEQQEYAARGYPFSLHVVLTYRVEGNTLTCEFVVRNVGAEDAPLGVGFHPYYTVGTAIDQTEIKVPAAHYLELADTLAPTGTLLPVDTTGFNVNEYRRIGAMRFNHCFVNLIRDGKGICTVPLRNPDTGRTISISMDRSFTSFVLYTGDAIHHAPRRALAVEPMTCASDAFNHPEWGLKRLEPAEEFSGAYRISASET